MQIFIELTIKYNKLLTDNGLNKSIDFILSSEFNLPAFEIFEEIGDQWYYHHDNPLTMDPDIIAATLKHMTREQYRKSRLYYDYDLKNLINDHQDLRRYTYSLSYFIENNPLLDSLQQNFFEYMDLKDNHNKYLLTTKEMMILHNTVELENNRRSVLFRYIDALNALLFRKDKYDDTEFNKILNYITETTKYLAHLCQINNQNSKIDKIIVLFDALEYIINDLKNELSANFKKQINKKDQNNVVILLKNISDTTLKFIKEKLASLCKLLHISQNKIHTWFFQHMVKNLSIQ